MAVSNVTPFPPDTQVSNTEQSRQEGEIERAGQTVRKDQKNEENRAKELNRIGTEINISV